MYVCNVCVYVSRPITHRWMCIFMHLCIVCLCICAVIHTCMYVHEGLIVMHLIVCTHGYPLAHASFLHIGPYMYIQFLKEACSVSRLLAALHSRIHESRFRTS